MVGALRGVRVRKGGAMVVEVNVGVLAALGEVMKQEGWRVEVVEREYRISEGEEGLGNFLG